MVNQLSLLPPAQTYKAAPSDMAFMGRSEANSFKIDAPDFHALASNQERCVKNGYLVKQGQFNTASWKKRWFELAEHWPLLYYFDSDDGGKALGVIVLKAATYELAAAGDVVGVDAAKRAFDKDAAPAPILVKTVSGIAYRLLASTADEARAWLDAFDRSAKAHDDGVQRQLNDVLEHNRRINLHVEHLADENAKILDELNVTRARLRHRGRGGSVGTLWSPPTASVATSRNFVSRNAASISPCAPSSS